MRTPTPNPLTPPAAEPAAATPLTSELVAVLERCWAAIRLRHPDAAEAVVILGAGSGRRGRPDAGHFEAARWRVPREGDRAEVMVAGELFGGPVDDILEVLLHEATHAVAHTRRIPECCKSGRYHNANFAALARELGLEVRLESSLGWHDTTLPRATAASYAEVLEDLARAQLAARKLHRLLPESPAAAAPGGTRKARVFRHALQCACPRRITAAPTVVGLGPIMCGLCHEVFKAKPQEEIE